MSEIEKVELKIKCKITLKSHKMNKTVNFLGTGEKQWGCEFLL